MSGLENLQTRLRYRGGNQEGRMIKDKLQTLKKAMLYSYQGATIELADGREFRCLINPDKLKNDYDNKIISIPYKDICLNKDKIGTTTEGEEEIGLKPGDVFRWKETDTYWIVYLQYLEEDAYFRAELRRCKSIATINGNEYRVYARGPVETSVQWFQKGGIEYNKLNYSLIVYITKNEETLDYFKRFAKVDIDGDPYKVAAKDTKGGDGIIELALDEDYSNPIEDEFPPEEETPIISLIQGQHEVYPYDIVTYTIDGLNGTWSIDGTKAKILEQDSTMAVVEVVASKSGAFNVCYHQEGQDDIVLPVKILSL